MLTATVGGNTAVCALETFVAHVMQTDIAVVGGGLAGSLASALLGRAGHDVTMIDPHDLFPPDFRCEKLESGRIDLLRKNGLADAVLRTATHTDQLWIARFGRVIDKMPFDQYGLVYQDLVNAVRKEIPPSVRVCQTWVDAIATGPEQQRVSLRSGDPIEARLVVMASGLNWTLRNALGIRRTLVSACHSITIGFDLRPTDRDDFDFPALQYNPERVGNGLGYLTLFRIGRSMRANLFVYGPLKSPWMALLRENSTAALAELMPGLSGIIGSYEVAGPVKVRPTDLHEMQTFEMAGLVLVGDAFTTPCPATGTGTFKVINDVDRLCNVHIPQWLATPGMGSEKISRFYRDPVKRACDAMSVSQAYRLKALSTQRGPRWVTERSLRSAVRLVRWGLRSALRNGTQFLRSGFPARAWIDSLPRTSQVSEYPVSGVDADRPNRAN